MYNSFNAGFGYMTSDGLPPRGGVFTASGVPPLTIRRALPLPPQSITIHGNTINGIGVGDKTANLLDMFHPRKNNNIQLTKINDESVSVSTDSTNQYLSYMIPVNAGQVYILHSYGFRLNSGQSSIAGAVSVLNDDTYIISRYRSTIFSSKKFTAPASEIEIRVDISGGYGGTNLTLFALALYEQAQKPDSYEPYGFRLPISFDNANGDSRRFNTFIDQPLFNGDNHTIPQASVPSLFKGTNIIRVDTSVPPSSIDITYMR